MADVPNPYAPPQHDDPGPNSSPDSRLNNGSVAHLEAIRREHITAEANIKGLAILLYIAAAGVGLSGLGLFMKGDFWGLIDVIRAVMMVMSGVWFRRLDPHGRVLYTILVAIGIAFTLFEHASQPAGVLLGRLFFPLLFLAAVWGAKAKVVLTPHYRDVVIPATPHVKNKTSPVLIGVLVILVLILVLSIANSALD
jgi:hypothetical protein